MLTKTSVIKTMDKLPSNFSIDDLVEQLIFIDKIQEGLKQSKEGQIHSKEIAKKKLNKWLK